MADDKPIIIIKKKGGHGGHHGGAWKVAYADFVTAMMAFFMVMWLVNTAEVRIKTAIASYFRKPGIFESGSGTPLMIGEAGILQDGYVPPHPEDTKQMYSGRSSDELKEKTGTDARSDGNKRITYRGDEGKRDSVLDQDISQQGFNTDDPDDPVQKKAIILPPDGIGPSETLSKMIERDPRIKIQKEQLEQLVEQIKQQILSAPDMKELLGLVEIKVDADGLTIEIMDTDKTSMFLSGSAQTLPQAEEAFQKLGPLLAALPNTVEIVGHTDSKRFGKRPGGYGNWDLSADRANAARRLLEKYGVPMERIASVSGRADKELKDTANSEAPVNRRISLKVRFLKEPTKAAPTAAPTPVATRHDPIETQLPNDSSPHPVRPEINVPVEQGAPVAQKRNRIKLGDAPVPAENPPPSSKDAIFGDSPVIGPGDPFANMQ